MLGLSLLLGYGACKIYDESLLLPAEDKPDANAGVGWWSKKLTSEGQCFSAGQPKQADRPSKQSAKNVGPIYLAIRTMKLGALDDKGEKDPEAWERQGFDLDGICTNSSSCPGATRDVAACQKTGKTVAYDGQYCRDNTFGRLESTLITGAEDIAQRYKLDDNAFNCSLCRGEFTFLIRIDQYNGEADDDTVRVDMYPSPGLETPVPIECSGNQWRTAVCFTPSQRFTVQEDFLTDPSRTGSLLSPSKLYDDKAYVKDGYLVLRLPEDTLFRFPSRPGQTATFPIRLNSAVVTAKIAKDRDQTWQATDGIIAGRVKQSDLIDGFRLIGVCENESAYDFMLEQIGENLDVLSNGNNDPKKPCDAMSLAVGFTATQATPGGAVAVEPLTECPFGTDPADGGAR